MQTLIISDDQNTVIYEGKKFIARKDTKKKSGCSNCDLRGIWICDKIPCSSISGGLKRKDGKEVHFKLKQKIKS